MKLPRDRTLLALTIYGLLNTVLYCSLQPLWEGIDEPFHYGYAQTLSTRGRFPVVGQTPISEEIWQSLHLAPASSIMRQNLSFVTTYSEYVALPDSERSARRRLLELIPPSLREESAPVPNYEGQQAPLAYFPLAAADRLLRDTPLPRRILALRLIAGLTACALQLTATVVLGGMLGLGSGPLRLCLFLVLSSQVFYAATNHVANEWLAIPLTSWLLIALIRFTEKPDHRRATLLGFMVTAGLLTKAYFLSWALFSGLVAAWTIRRNRAALGPSLVALAMVLIASGPWYARNLRLYGSLSGMIDTAGGAGAPARLWEAVTALPWTRALAASARGALWTGNNLPETFSSATLDLILALMLVAGVISVRAGRGVASRAECLVTLGCVSFVPALVYSCVLLYSFTQNPAVMVASWYTEAIVAPISCLLCLGLGRSGRLGRWLGSALAATASYLLCATYLVKLIPIYSGHPGGPVRLPALWNWYTGDPDRWYRALGDTTLGDSGFVCIMMVGVVVLAVALGVRAQLWLGSTAEPCWVQQASTRN